MNFNFNTIILIDKENQHGLLIKNFFKPPLEEINYNFIWERISNNSLEITLSKYINDINGIFCIPLSWSSSKYNGLLQKINKKNIIIAPYDKENLFPWSLLPKEQVAFSFNNILLPDPNGYITLTGTSATCALMAKSYVKNPPITNIL